MIEFFVPGMPAPQGSKRHVGNGRMIESSKKLPAWRAAVTLAAKQHAPRTPLDCPLSVQVVFFLPRPLRPRFDAPAVHPDADKLARAVGDALQDSQLIKDDSRITHWSITKTYAIDTPTGAHITIKEAA